MSNKTKIIIAGTTVTFVSPHKLEDLKRVARYAPNACVLKDEDGNAEYVLSAGVVGCINDTFASYASTTPDGTGLACMSTGLPVIQGMDAKKAVAETYGPSVAKMNKIEDQIDEALESVNAMLTDIEDGITMPNTEE